MTVTLRYAKQASEIIHDCHFIENMLFQTASNEWEFKTEIEDEESELEEATFLCQISIIN